MNTMMAFGALALGQILYLIQQERCLKTINNNIDKNRYIVKKLRSPNTFNPSNRCTLEISQEQYETLLQNIHKDYQITIDIKPQTKQYKNYDYRYN